MKMRKFLSWRRHRDADFKVDAFSPETSVYAWMGRDKDGVLHSDSAEMTLEESVSLIRRLMTGGWTSFRMWRQDGTGNVLVARMSTTTEAPPPPEYQPPEDDDDPYFTQEET
jgi:hypothetical protein